MSGLDWFLSQSIHSSYFEMIIKVAFSLQGKRTGTTAIFGDRGDFGTYGEIILEMIPEISIKYYGPTAGLMYDGTFSDFSYATSDVVLVAHPDADSEKMLFDHLSRNRPDDWHGALVSYHDSLNGIVRTLSELPRYDGSLNIRKVAAIAAALTFAPSAAIIECGVYKGGTTVFLAKLQGNLGQKRDIFALDTFEGLPTPTQTDLSLGSSWPEGFLNDTSYEAVSDYLQQMGVRDQITLVKGLSQENLPKVLKETGNIGFAFLDMDQYSGTIESLGIISSFIAGGGIVLVDDAQNGGVNMALEEAVERYGFFRNSLCYNFDLLSKPPTGFS